MKYLALWDVEHIEHEAQPIIIIAPDIPTVWTTGPRVQFTMTMDSARKLLDNLRAALSQARKFEKRMHNRKPNERKHP